MSILLAAALGRSSSVFDPAFQLMNTLLSRRKPFSGTARARSFLWHPFVARPVHFPGEAVGLRRPPGRADAGHQLIEPGHRICPPPGSVAADPARSRQVRHDWGRLWRVLVHQEFQSDRPLGGQTRLGPTVAGTCAPGVPTVTGRWQVGHDWGRLWHQVHQESCPVTGRLAGRSDDVRPAALLGDSLPCHNRLQSA